MIDSFLPEALRIYMEQSAQRSACLCLLIASLFSSQVRHVLVAASLLKSHIRLAMELETVSRSRRDHNDGTDTFWNVLLP